MNEEAYIREKAGSRSPFAVPDGYFDHFATEFMANLPANEQKATKKVALRPWMYAAASLLAVIFSVTLYFMQPADREEQQAQNNVALSDSYIDEAADYAMLDNADIYACLLDN